MATFRYGRIAKDQKKIIHSFHEDGYIALEGVSGFKETYAAFLKEAQKFIGLDVEIQKRLTPTNAFEAGWAFGIEQFNGVRDSFKGSYYAFVDPEREHKNHWPTDELPLFQKAYMRLAKLFYQVGQELLHCLHIDLPYYAAKARMLYYGEVNDANNDGSENWCGLHRDHGLFTGLCPAVYFKDGKRIPEPENAGLFINDKKIVTPDDAMLFQVGEVAQLITNGDITATDHLVKKALGCARYTMALFIDAPEDFVIYSNVETYNDRFQSGMTYGEWAQRSYEKYK